MSRMLARLALALGAPAIAVCLVAADASPAPVLAAVTLAALAVLACLTSLAATAVPSRPTPHTGSADQPHAVLAARLTDPLHHPIRPRAPGLA